MTKRDHPDDPSLMELKDVDMKLGFRSFEWWFGGFSYFALPIFWSFGQWWGPCGYRNGGWEGWKLHFYFLCFGCELEWTSKWIPYDAADPVPQKRERRRRATPEAIARRLKGET